MAKTETYFIYRRKLDCFCYLFQVTGKKADCISFYNSFNTDYKESFGFERHGRKTGNLFAVYSNKKIKIAGGKNGSPMSDAAKLYHLDIMVNYASFLDVREGKYGKCSGIYNHYDEEGNRIKDECPETMYLDSIKEAVNYWADLYDGRNKLEYSILNEEFAQIYGKDAINDVFCDIDRNQRTAIAKKWGYKKTKQSDVSPEDYLVERFLKTYLDDEMCFYDFLSSLRFDMMLIKKYGAD